MNKSDPNSKIRVIYDEHHITTERPGAGYTYYSEEPVCIGDIVMVPPTTLDLLRSNREPRVATVVSLKGDYDGYVDYILKIVKRRGESPLDHAIDSIKKMDHPDELLEYEIIPVGFDRIEVMVDGMSLGFADVESEELVQTLVDRLNGAESTRHEAQYRKRETDIVAMLNSTITR